MSMELCVHQPSIHMQQPGSKHSLIMTNAHSIFALNELTVNLLGKTHMNIFLQHSLIIHGSEVH